jgi:two-component SAPR family response regulator
VFNSETMTTKAARNHRLKGSNKQRKGRNSKVEIKCFASKVEQIDDENQVDWVQKKGRT